MSTLKVPVDRLSMTGRAETPDQLHSRSPQSATASSSSNISGGALGGENGGNSMKNLQDPHWLSRHPPKTQSF